VVSEMELHIKNLKIKRRRQMKRRGLEHLIILKNIKPTNKSVKAQARKELGEVRIIGWHTEGSYLEEECTFDSIISIKNVYVRVRYIE
jgi:hypothetical protein